jgi:hypothetical protein
MIATFCVVMMARIDVIAELRAHNGAKLLEQAVKTYYLLHGKWPAQANDVVAHLEDGKKALLSPWGIPYQYILRIEDGRVVPYVWTEREVDGKAKIYGKKPPEEKKK